MKYIIVFILASWPAWSSASESNQAMKQCIKNTENFAAAANCHTKYRQQVRDKELAELRDFLEHNPRYKVPGQSLNRCWGKPREMPFESSYMRVDEHGFEASVNYKDTLPAGCYENAPWDNRNEK